VTLLDTLQPPSPLDATASAYKDWFHLNFVEPESGTVGLINTALHGSPWDERARAIGTILVHSPQWGWKSHVEIMAYSEANLAPSVVALRNIALAIDGRSGTIHASSRGASNPFHARFLAEPISAPIDFEQQMPLGNGWISWYLVSNMSLSGDWTTQGSRTILSKVPAYHDHNWGRWHWGDDFGWEWGCFLRNPANPCAASMVFARITDRAHRHFEKAFLAVDAGSARRFFGADNVALRFGGRFDSALHRVPGAMAALHQEMAEPRLPRTIEISAAQGSDCVKVSFEARAAAQLITAEPNVRGYGFIHEIVGEYAGAGSLRGVPFETAGYAVFEYVM
jgi:hypothetical protein